MEVKQGTHHMKNILIIIQQNQFHEGVRVY